MTAIATLRRARRMTAGELRFRAASALRTQRDRARHHLRPAAWNRETLASSLSQAIPSLHEAAGFIRRREWDRAEAIVRRHFGARASAWPIAARDRDEIVEALRAGFPAARTSAVARGDRTLGGEYDLLGYRALSYGRVPDWHLDIVHRRHAPRGFWADVPYLDPACGDHKIIWELNRHQHWMSLGRAYWLDGNPAYACAFVDQLYSWLDANPPLGGVNWASMLELGFRSISWMWALEFFADADPSIAGGRPWRLDLLTGLDRQLRHIAQNLSRYFSPNTHLTGEALALYAVSLALPELRESRTRAAIGREVLLQESRRQILPDGGHAERSTHYHRYSTDFYLLATIVARRCGDPAAAAFAASAAAQARVLRTLADERGGLQTIGDDDGGQLFAMCGTAPADVRTTLAVAAEVVGEPSLAVSGPTEESSWVTGQRPAAGARAIAIASSPARWPSRLLPDSGYFVARARGELAIFDAGDHGFLNGGHAHADALSIVATVGSKPLLIDPGTGTYTMDRALRERLRSGRMHNTVLVDGAEHTAARAAFHWKKRTDARFLFTHTADRGDIAQGMHDGYPDARHVRTLFAVHGAGWLVVDQIVGHGRHRAESFWHLDPAWTPRYTGDGMTLTTLSSSCGRTSTSATSATSASSRRSVAVPEATTMIGARVCSRIAATSVPGNASDRVPWRMQFR